MKGGEGWFLVVLSITVCMPDIYIDRVKGDGFFSFRSSNFQSYNAVIFDTKSPIPENINFSGAPFITSISIIMP